MTNQTKTNVKIITSNKKAHFNYFLSEFLECGIELKGTEIKSIRENGCSLADSYIVIRNGQAEILNMHINPYSHGSIFNVDPLRTRRLLMHKKQIEHYSEQIKRGGFTVVPTKAYLSQGKCKVEIALAKGKKHYDKRETIKERDIARKLRKGEND